MERGGGKGRETEGEKEGKWRGREGGRVGEREERWR